MSVKKTTMKQSSLRDSSLCPICNQHRAHQQCNQCHSVVCRDCFFPLVGICSSCVAKPVAKKWKKRPVNWEKELGVQWID